jgi:hypothetical protein
LLRNFHTAFDAAARRLPDLEARFANSSLWSDVMLGPGGVLPETARGWADVSGFAGSASSQHAQWYTLDLCLVAPAYSGAGDYWNSRTVLAIEHENDSDVETEMWKLAHWRSDLSVLVFYDFSETARREDGPSGDKWMPGVSKCNWLQAKCERLSGIVRNVEPNDGLRHVLIVGQRTSGPAPIQWRAATWENGGFTHPRPLEEQITGDY